MTRRSYVVLLAGVVVAIGLAACALILLPSAVAYYSRIDVSLVNELPQAIHDVHLTHRHGSLETIPTLDSGAQATCWIYPNRGSSLRISYWDGTGQLHVAEGDIYVGSNGPSKAAIAVQETGVVFRQAP